MSAQGLPPHILSLFGPRPPVEPLPQSRLSFRPSRRGHEQSGCAEYIDLFEESLEHEKVQKEKKKLIFEPARLRRLRKMKEKYLKHKEKIGKLARQFDPKNDPNAAGDVAKSLFIARISFDTSERKLRKELEQYGVVKNLKMVTDKISGRPRGYQINLQYYYSVLCHCKD